MMFKFCTYGDQARFENLDCVDQLELGQVGYLLNHPRSIVFIMDRKQTVQLGLDVCL